MANSLGRRLIGGTEDLGSGMRILTRSPGFAASAALLALSVAMGAVIQGLLFGVTPLDPTTYGAVVAIVGIQTLAAYAVPAGRAAHTQPSIALRHE